LQGGKIVVTVIVMKMQGKPIVDVTLTDETIIHTCEVTVAPSRLDMPQSALRPAAIAGPVRCLWCVW